MNSWKKTYVIVTLCFIAAGLIYLKLPISQNQGYIDNKEDSAVMETAELKGNVLYRIKGNEIETSKGTYTLSDTVKWIGDGAEIEQGQGRFLGQDIEIVQDKEGKITQIETKQDLTAPQRIRIVLSANAAAESYIHKKVVVTCSEAFWSIQDGAIQAHPPGAEIGAEAFVRRAVFYPAVEGSALTLITPKGTNSYLGQLEVTAENGGYSVVNEVSLETYLMGVVPSEMPGSYGAEAAKVQAVCARSYAYCQWLGSEKFASWGAQIDDSIRSQVYGGVVNHDASEQGIQDTWGQILTYEGGPVSTNYFSTSCGYTANGSEVWGGSEVAYQKGRAQFNEGDYGDLSQEEAFHTFITDQTVAAFDSQSPWFRWSAEISLEKLQDMTMQYLSASPTVKVVKEDSLIEEAISSIGEVTDIFVYERSETGMALSILLIGSEKSIVVEKPMEIRKLLGGVSVMLMNSELAGERELLPSAFISLEKIKDTEEKLVSVKICGGGYGHGVGMSQNGVKGMLEAGYTYEAILAHYFPGTEIEVL